MNCEIPLLQHFPFKFPDPLFAGAFTRETGRCMWGECLMTGACSGSAPSRCATQSIQMSFSSINNLDWKGNRVSLQVNDPIRSNLIVISAVVDHYSIMLRLWCGLTEVAQFNSLQLMYFVKALVSMLIFPLHFPSDISVALFVHHFMSFSFFESQPSSHSFVSLTLSFLACQCKCACARG